VVIVIEYGPLMQYPVKSHNSRSLSTLPGTDVGLVHSKFIMIEFTEIHVSLDVDSK
jgi:hypothetical protein